MIKSVGELILELDLKDRIERRQSLYDRNCKICAIIDINKLHKLITGRNIDPSEFDILWDMSHNEEVFAVFNRLYVIYQLGNRSNHSLFP